MKYLPPNVTPLIQPKDQGVIQNFKCKYRVSFIQGLINSDCSVKDFQSTFNMKDAIFAAAVAWQEVKNDTLIKAWRKLWPAVMNNPLSEHNELDDLDDPESQLLETVKNAAEGCSSLSKMSDEVFDWLDVDKDEPTVEEINDETIIQSVLNPQTVQEVESDEEEEGSASNNVTWREATDVIHTFVKFVETNKHYNMAEVMNLHIIHNDFLNKRSNNKRQVDIRSFF